ncbi:MAG: hypothetical protein NVS1B13_04980 [Flavisolibacter sp.]
MRRTFNQIFFLLATSLLSLSSEAQIKDTLINTYFLSNAYTIDSLQDPCFENILKRIYAVKKITGYADSIGTSSYNLALSKKRADAVAQLLEKMDVPCGEVSYKGKDHFNDPLLWKNRRVEIHAVLRDYAFVKAEPASQIVASISLDNIYFVPDMARITDASLPYLEALAKLLKSSYKTEFFDIVGHVNYQSHKDSVQLRDLFMLSERRARAVYQYLADQGIAKERMHYKGLGNAQPVIAYPQDEEQKKKNMRVQVIVIKPQ